MMGILPFIFNEMFLSSRTPIRDPEFLDPSLRRNPGGQRHKKMNMDNNVDDTSLNTTEITPEVMDLTVR